MGDYNKPRVYNSEILKDMISKITPEELELVENEMLGMVEEPYTFKGGNSERINTLYGIMPEEMEEIYNIHADVVIMDWEEILFDFIDFYPCILPHELFMWLEENYEIPKKKKL
jgi:hypothetical protein